MPMRQRNFRKRLPRKPFTSIPSTVMLPDRMGRNPLIARKRLVLPAPLGPTMASFSPRRTLRDISLSTGAALWVRETTRSRISSIGGTTNQLVSKKAAKPAVSVKLEQLQFLGNQAQNRIFLIIGPDKILTPENSENVIILAFSKVGESLRELFLRGLINVFAGHPYIVHEGLRGIEDTHLGGVEFAFRHHGVVHSFVQSTGISSAG